MSHSAIAVTLPSQAPLLAPVTGARRPRILVVEDEAPVLMFIDRVLQSGGYQTALAADGAEALRAAAAWGPFDLLVTDLRMPRMRGDELADRLRRNQADLKVLYLTGYSQELRSSKVASWSSVACLDKPCSVNRLLDAVSSLMREHSHASIGAGARLRLLLVDDCIDERDLNTLALETDFAVLTAGRGDEGVTVAVRERPDVIVLDVNMPGMDGWETCTALKCNPVTADIPVILLTGSADRDLTHHATAVGASAILRKPCPSDALRETVLAAAGRDPIL